MYQGLHAGDGTPVELRSEIKTGSPCEQGYIARNEREERTGGGCMFMSETGHVGVPNWYAYILVN
jgi:hypothetical protein